MFHIVFALRSSTAFSVARCYYELSKAIGIAVRYEERWVGEMKCWLELLWTTFFPGTLLICNYCPCLNFICRWTSLFVLKEVSQMLHLWFLILECILFTWWINWDRSLKVLEHSVHTISFSFLCTDLICVSNICFCFAAKLHSLQGNFLLSKWTFLICLVKSELSEKAWSQRSHRKSLILSWIALLCFLMTWLLVAVREHLLLL